MFGGGEGRSAEVEKTTKEVNEIKVPPAPLESARSIRENGDDGDGINVEIKPTRLLWAPGLYSSRFVDSEPHEGQTMHARHSSQSAAFDSRGQLSGVLPEAVPGADGRVRDTQRSMDEDEMKKLLNMGFEATLVE